jgi:hypothetical protein
MSLSRSATETEYIQYGRRGPAPPLRPPSCWPPPAWPAEPERTAELQSPARGQPPRRFLGVRKCRKKCLRDYGRIARASKIGACNGPGVQVRGAKRDGDARWRACVRHVGCTTETGSGQPAAGRNAPRECAARDGKNGGAWGFAARAQTAEGCTTHAVVPQALCTLPPVRRPGWTRGAFG